MRHLKDEEIQSYLQNGRSGNWKHVEDHLNTCSECRSQLLLYEKFGDMVLSTVSSQIPNGFEKIVMRRLKRTQRQRRITDLVVAAVALISILTAGAVFLLTPQIRQVVTGFLADAWQCTIQLTSGNGGSAESLAIPLIGILLIVLFAAIDRPIGAKLKTVKEARI